MLEKINYLTAGESHGRGLLGIIEGIPSNLEIDENFIREQLSRRQKGYGRGSRMKIESDFAQIYCGVRHGITIGAPIGLIIENKDFKNWEDAMSVHKNNYNHKNCWYFVDKFIKVCCSLIYFFLKSQIY